MIQRIDLAVKNVSFAAIYMENSRERIFINIETTEFFQHRIVYTSILLILEYVRIIFDDKYLHVTNYKK